MKGGSLVRWLETRGHTTQICAKTRTDGGCGQSGKVSKTVLTLVRKVAIIA